MLAKLLDISQPMMSRLDNAIGPPPTELVVNAWLDAVGADDDTRLRVRALAQAAYGETTPWPELLSEKPHLQDDVQARESASVRVRNFQPTVIAGLLQTAGYASAVIPLADITGQVDHAASVAARLRRQEILHEPGRRFEFILGEHVLRWSPGVGVMPAQLDRLTQLATLPTVAIAVLPELAQSATPWHNFVLHERADSTAYATTELIHGPQEIHDRANVTLYQGFWDRLWAMSATGDAATGLIREALRRLG